MPYYGGSEVEEERDMAARAIMQGSIALSQMLEGRNIRVMGASKRDDPPFIRSQTLKAHQVFNMCDAFLWGYYMPSFALFWYLVDDSKKKRDYAKIRENTLKLESFRSIYSVFAVMHEMAMTLFDLYFDQYHTITTMLGIADEEMEKEEKSKGLQWMATDIEKLSSRMRGMHAAKDRAEELGIKSQEKGIFPNFEEALQLARMNRNSLLRMADKLGLLEAPEEEEIPQPKKRKRKKKPKKDLPIKDDGVETGEKVDFIVPDEVEELEEEKDEQA